MSSADEPCSSKNAEVRLEGNILNEATGGPQSKIFDEATVRTEGEIFNEATEYQM